VFVDFLIEKNIAILKIFVLAGEHVVDLQRCKTGLPTIIYIGDKTLYARSGIDIMHFDLQDVGVLNSISPLSII
jgi:uncharacterized protein YbbC (DUF1343 family)